MFEICDSVTVFKDGTYVDSVDIKDINEQELVTMMIGREMSDYFEKLQIGEETFRVTDLNNGRMVRNINFGVCKGEVLGISGLVGSGRTETIRAIIGADKKESGKIELW